VSTIAARFWLGMVLPVFCLALVLVVLVTVGGKGKEFAPVVILILSFTTLPATMLANAWVLFATWRPGFLVAGAFVLPGLVAAPMAVFILGTDAQRDAAAYLLAPFFVLTEIAGRHPAAAFAIWSAAIVGLILLAARWRGAGLRASREA
jgi:hypothetical protein